MSKQKRQQLDAFDEQDGRTRLYKDQFEDFIQFYASVKTIATCLKNVETVAKLHPGTFSKLKSGFALIQNAMVQMTTKISVHQYKMLTRNKGAIVFQPAAEYPRFAMDEDQYYRLVIAARIGACQQCMSCMEHREWCRCELRKTLDTVPCREGIHEKHQFDKGICPYAIVDPEEFRKAAENL